MSFDTKVKFLGAASDVFFCNSVGSIWKIFIPFAGLQDVWSSWILKQQPMHDVSTKSLRGVIGFFWVPSWDLRMPSWDLRMPSWDLRMPSWDLRMECVVENQRFRFLFNTDAT